MEASRHVLYHLSCTSAACDVKGEHDAHVSARQSHTVKYITEVLGTLVTLQTLAATCSTIEVLERLRGHMSRSGGHISDRLNEPVSPPLALG